MTVLIAGAGIAGLSLALSCHQVGIPVRVIEAVGELEPLGVGINLQPHAVRELFELGLERELDAIGVATQEVAYFSKTGRQIWSEPRGRLAGYRWPQYSVHRGHLQMMLYEAVLSRIGPDAVRLGTRLDRVDQSDDGITAQVVSRDGAEEALDASILIGADGIHSAVRHQFNPDEGPPVWGGAILWRGTTVAEPFLTGATMAMAGHEFQKFVTYPISNADPDTGTALINWIAELKVDPSQGWNREDWNRPGDPDDFMPEFASWRFDWLDVPALVEARDAVYEYPMVDRDPLERWTHGRVTLIGDAAHPMYPIGSNGASQAIVDARVLTRALHERGIGPAALEAYEDDRRPATARIVLANRGNGPDQIMQIVEERCEGVFDDIEDVLSHAEREARAREYKALAGFGVDDLNARAPIVPAEWARPT